jgi:hypothetical protein
MTSRCGWWRRWTSPVTSNLRKDFQQVPMPFLRCVRRMTTLSHPPVSSLRIGALSGVLHLALAGVLFFTLSAGAAEPGSAPQDAQAAIGRSLSFLVKDSRAWKEEHGCVSCHHASLVVWATTEARTRGHAVDGAFLDETVAWLIKAGDGAKRVPARPAAVPRAMNYHAPNHALALAASPAPSGEVRAALKVLRNTVRSEQIENGSWLAWPDTRPPIFGASNQVSTAFAALALASGPAAELDAESKAATDRASAWLRSAGPDDELQASTLRLMLAARCAEPDSVTKPLVDEIRRRQNSDGGWSQIKSMASDAYATGQALYALAGAKMDPADDAIKRGQAFLLKTQRPDGAWPMTSRPCPPSNKGAGNLIPITGAAASWATLGLVRSSPVVANK